MRINSIDNNSFGQIYCPEYIKAATEAALRKRYLSGNQELIKFAENFSQRWQRCQNTKYADLHILNPKTIYVKGKTLGTMKRIDSFMDPVLNIDSGLKHVVMAEELQLRV